jgi:DNA-binding protein H-NS
MNILKEANKIINERSEEKERMYGPFQEGMERAADIFNGMTGLKITAVEMYKALIALKLSRESYNHKEDNLLDAVAYMASMNDYLNK